MVLVAVVPHLKALNLYPQNFVVAVIYVHCVGYCAMNENVFDHQQVMYDT